MDVYSTLGFALLMMSSTRKKYIEEQDSKKEVDCGAQQIQESIKVIKLSYTSLLHAEN